MTSVVVCFRHSSLPFLPLTASMPNADVSSPMLAYQIAHDQETPTVAMRTTSM
jgi:hypothetical protein